VIRLAVNYDSFDAVARAYRRGLPLPSMTFVIDDQRIQLPTFKASRHGVGVFGDSRDVRYVWTGAGDLGASRRYSQVFASISVTRRYAAGCICFANKQYRILTVGRTFYVRTVREQLLPPPARALRAAAARAPPTPSQRQPGRQLGNVVSPPRSTRRDSSPPLFGSRGLLSLGM
jgi:hypothetical protein